MSEPVNTGSETAAESVLIPGACLPERPDTNLPEAIGVARSHMWDDWFAALIYRDMGAIFGSRPVQRGGPVKPLKTNKRDLPSIEYKGELVTVESALDQLYTNAFMVMRDDEVVHEQYRNLTSSETRFMSWSLGKSLVSILFGIAIDKGFIRSIEQQVKEYLPELAETVYGDVTIKQVLEMRSGTGYQEFPGGELGYVDHFCQESIVWERMRAVDVAFVVDRSGTPGETFKYASLDTAVLGWLLEKAVGQTLASFKSEHLWQPLGMEADGYWLMDGPEGVGREFAAGGMNATMRDYARIGRMMMDGGRCDGQQIVSQAWVEESTRLKSTQGDILGSGYGYQWWQIGELQAYSGVGLGGQYVYVHPETKTIIVKLSYVPVEQTAVSMQDHGLFFDAIAKSAF